MPTTPSTINYYVAADGTLRDGSAGSIAQTPRIYYGTEYAVTLSFPPSTIAEGDQLQVAVNRTRTFFSSASATGDAPVAAVAKHDVTSAEVAAQSVTLTLSTNTRAMIDQVNGIDHPVRGFFGVHVLRGQSFVTLAIADALMMSLESGPDAISPSLPVVDYPTREEAEALAERSKTAAGRAETAEDNAQIWAEGTDRQVEELGGEHSAKEYNRLAGVSATNAEQSATNAGQSSTQAGQANEAAQTAKSNAAKIAEGSDADVAPLGLEHSAKVWAQKAAATLANKRDILQTLVTSSSTALEVEAGKSYNWTVSAASTIALAAADKVAGKETRIDIYIDLQDGGSVSGDGVAVADAVLQSGWYKLIWDGTNATLYSTKAGGAASVITIPASTTSYSLQDNKHYQQVPDSAPTYTLPTATMDGLVHEITVLVDFMHVTSCSFVDAGGVPVTLQSAISPSIGEAYIFRCYWYGKWRVVPLKIRNAATVSSATGVVEVSDAVAGDALALKMVAPRSVVVNQLSDSKNTSEWKIYQFSVNSSFTFENDVWTLTSVGSGISVRSVQFQPSKAAFISGHTYAVYFESRKVTASAAYFGWRQNAQNNNPLCVAFAPQNDSNTWTAHSNIGTATRSVDGAAVALSIYVLNSTASGLYAELRNMMCVDLTQYFNGDQTLIDSIQTWDDLVAYDPRFASYVAYNTGEVVGAQPTVKVTGKNLFDQSRFLTEVTGCTLTQDGYYTAPTANFYATYYSNNGSLLPSSAFKQGVQYTVRALGYGNKTDGANFYITIFHTDGTHVNSSGTTSTVTEITVTSTQGKTVNKICFTWSGGNTSYIKDVQIEIASSATPYEPYHDGGAAQAPAQLFAVGTAADEYEAVSGVTTRKLGIVDLGTLEYNDYTSGSGSGSAYPYGYSAFRIPGRAGGSVNFITPMYRSSSNYQLDKSITGTPTNSTCYIIDASFQGKTGAEIQASLSGVMLYYELTEPTTSASTPTQISLQAGSNVVTQTDGGRTLAELALTYENLPSES